MNPSLAKAYQEAIDYGIDVNLVDCNLELTFEKRLQEHQGALELVLALQEAGRLMREQSRKHPKSTIGSQD